MEGESAQRVSGEDKSSRMGSSTLKCIKILQGKGQTGKFAEVSITETIRQAMRRVGSPRGRRPEDPQHFRGAEGRRAHGRQRESGQTRPEEQGEKGVPRKLGGGR